MIELIFITTWVLIGFFALEWESKLSKEQYGFGLTIMLIALGPCTLGLALAELGPKRQDYGLSWCDMTAKKFHKAKKRYEKAKAKFTKKALREHSIVLNGLLHMADGKIFNFTCVLEPSVYTWGPRSEWRTTKPTVTDAKNAYIAKLKKEGFSTEESADLKNVGFTTENCAKYPYHSIVSIDFEHS